MQVRAGNDSSVGDALQKADTICRDRGLRFTALRRKVLAMIWSGPGPARAYDILNRLKGRDGPARPPTVYRTLDFLLENGLIHRLSSLNAYIGCAHPLRHSECYFLICSRCGEVGECCNSLLSDAISQTAQKNKFRPGRVTVEIEGQCWQCVGER